MYALALCCHYGGIDYMTRRLRGSCLSVLMLHRLRSDDDPLPLSLSPETFRWLIGLLERRGLLGSLEQGLTNVRERLAGSSYAVTLDDGYVDNLVVLRDGSPPPLTIYVSTSLVGEKTFWAYELVDALEKTDVEELDLSDMDLGRWSLSTEAARHDCLNELNDRLKALHIDRLEERVGEIVRRLGAERAERTDRMLTWDEVGQLSGAGVEIGSHTQRHGILARLTPEEAESEIAESRRILERELERPCRHFSYPNGAAGDFTQAIKEQVAAAGYQSAVTTIEGVNCGSIDPYEIKRINITEDRCRSPWGGRSAAYFLSYTSGFIAWIREVAGHR